jgi:hypothetical protein
MFIVRDDIVGRVEERAEKLHGIEQDGLPFIHLQECRPPYEMADDDRIATESQVESLWGSREARSVGRAGRAASS